MTRRATHRALSILLGLGLALAPAGFAQPETSELLQEIEALRQGQEAIRQELAEIKRLLQAQPAAAAPAGPDVRGKSFAVADNPAQGDPAARLALLEFTDYQCPYCSRHARDTHPQIARDYIDTGKLRYVAMALPLERLHPLAFKAAEAALCAGEQDRFWEMHERLFVHQRQLEPWDAHAEALGLDPAAFGACLTSGRHAATVRADMAEAAKAGASGTPSFVLALTDPADAGRVEGLAFIRGAQPFATFQAQIDAALASLGDTEPPRPE